MTEPTFRLRPDVSAQLDIVLARILVHVGIDDLETARDCIRDALSDAFHHGWMSGHDDATEQRRPTTENPYHWITEKSVAAGGGETQGESDTIS